MPEKSKSRKGRPRMPTGGSTRGTTVVWGDYGLRMKDHDRRISASQLKIGMETINRRLRGMDFKLYTRVSANIGVYTSGNEQRMGKGKGLYEFVKKGDPPVVGITKLTDGITLDSLKRARREITPTVITEQPSVSSASVTP
ncbi:ribosomal protein L16 [Uncinocarpus reesii 1704]|uniref:Ribosomal protein L16 n=1 Tax=Uncinocarpus reesii (strain UAMH 1704) TaxID=336963 RepID=C4JXM0_UNCRE|nr:ribosomal protein L16 [Uncinocarpus reesii 1704]EEP81528.1 ribosomal protein L16 [Uncinocarpus reesii 1704]